MVSLLKGKKAYLHLQNGSGTSVESLISPEKSVNEGVKRKKKKKKRKRGQVNVQPLVPSTSSVLASSNEIPTSSTSQNASINKPKLKLKKKQVKCDKLLLNMLKKKQKMKQKSSVSDFDAEKTLDRTVDEDVIEEKVKQPVPVHKKMLKRKVESDDQMPLIKTMEEVINPEKNNEELKPKLNGFHETTPVLPVNECRNLLIQRFLENDTLIVVGETGSGKSTQIPQFLLKDCPKLFSYRGLAITQPRRVAAISLANRVAYELGTEVGDLVGYKVRFDKLASEKTKITFVSDGYLMMDAIRDKFFDQYSVVIVDEAHERSVETDVVLSLLRNAQIIRKTRNPKKRLKLIVMSATLDVDKFKSFFNLEDHGLLTKAVYVKGRPYSLKLNYLPVNAPQNHLDLTWITLLKLHLELPPNHHILVFLTGKEEIDLVVARANAINQQRDMHRVYVCPLYAALSKEVQMKSFEMPPEDTRKIVVATNLAETSLTIPGIRIVIDSGRVKSKYFEESLGMNVLRVQLISKSQADQRAGRAGREFAGSVYRLYTRNDYDKMEEFPPPEVTRSNLSRVLLLGAVSLGINNLKNFPLPDPPSDKAIKFAMNELHRYGAIETNQLPVKVTRTAKRLLAFPVELHLAKVLYLAVQYQELSRICAIVAICTVESIYNPDMQEGEFRYNKYQTLWAPEGDFITFWRIFKEFKKSKNKKSWCKEYGIQFRTMIYVTQVWRHLLTICQNMDLEDDEKLSCGDAIDFKDKVQLIFKTAFSHQIARLSKTGGSYIVENQYDSSIKFGAKIHPSSSLVARKPGRLMFTHLSFNEVDNTVYMHNCAGL